MAYRSRGVQDTGYSLPEPKVDYPPEVVDRMGNPIINQSEVYSGMYGRERDFLSVHMFAARKASGAALVRCRS